MGTQTIQSQDISIANLFKDFYAVPDYQREYVWESEQVEQLLSDIHNEMASAPPELAPEYFIGSIVVCPSGDGVLALIDGQQRMTTLFLTLCAIRDTFQAIGVDAPKAIADQIASTSVDSLGQDVFRYRLDLQYADSGDVLVRVAEGNQDTPKTSPTRSVSNITNAYATICAFLSREFGTDEKALRIFYSYFITRVKLIRIQTEDVAKALKIFETINDRGVGLDSMDLLKNLLFMRARPADFESLKKIWKDLTDTIYAAREKPLRFLRYFIFSQYSVEVLREDDIYAWLSKNEAVCGYGKDPRGFATALLAAANAYAHFLKGQDEEGLRRPELESMQCLGGNAARQHLILLLAGRHLPRPLFDRLVREVENLFFVYVLTRENTRDFERNFAKWAPELRAVQSADQLDAFVQLRFLPAKAALSARFDEAFGRLEAGDVQGYRLKYMLAKLTQWVEQRAYGLTEGTRWLKPYLDASYEIEHIYPQEPSAKAIAESGVLSAPALVNRLGNLVLLEKSINASLGNKAYSDKASEYAKSSLLLVKALPAPHKVGVNTLINKAVESIRSFKTWNEQTISDRQANLRSIARNVWGVPDATPTMKG